MLEIRDNGYRRLANHFLRKSNTAVLYWSKGRPKRKNQLLKDRRGILKRRCWRSLFWRPVRHNTWTNIYRSSIWKSNFWSLSFLRPNGKSYTQQFNKIGSTKDLSSGKHLTAHQSSIKSSTRRTWRSRRVLLSVFAWSGNYHSTRHMPSAARRMHLPNKQGISQPRARKDFVTFHRMQGSRTLPWPS